MFTVIPSQRIAVDKEANKKMRTLSAESSAIAGKIEALEGNVDRLTLITQALWEVLQTKVGVEEAELVSLIEEIDLRDGKLDGKITKVPQKCEKCNQSVSVKTNMCFYCGHKNSE